MSDLVLVTANFGGIDELKPFPVAAGFDRFYYADRETIARASPEAAATWTRLIEPEYPHRDFGPRLRSKYFKCQVHRLPEVQAYKWLAWADSSLLLHDASFLQEAVDRLGSLPEKSRLMLLPHPHRKTVREEYDFVVTKIEQGFEYLCRRYSTEAMKKQIELFQRCGWNLDAKLWASGVWLIENNSAIRSCWDSWWQQVLSFGAMDQLSLPIVLENHGLCPQEFTWNRKMKRRVEFVQHQRMM